MAISFQCPKCNATRTAPSALAGRRVRCPECDALIEVVPAAEVDDVEEEGDGRGTVMLQPIDEEDAGSTVMLEAVDVVPAMAVSASLETGIPPRKPPTPKQVEEEDAPRQPKKAQLVETEMDMTPMVDATFQLLIFFMITAAFALQKSKEIPKPQSNEPSSQVAVPKDEEAAHAVTVRIDEFNSFVVINADGDEEEAPSVVDLHSKLRKAHDGDSEGRVPTTLRIEAHGEALHDRVITAIDAGNDAGFAEVQLASFEEDA